MKSMDASIRIEEALTKARQDNSSQVTFNTQDVIDYFEWVLERLDYVTAILERSL